MSRNRSFRKGVLAGVLGIVLASPVAHSGSPLQEAQALFASRKTVQLKAVGTGWVVVGEASDLKEYWEVRALVYALKDAGYQVGNSVLLSEAGYKKLIAEMNTATGSSEVLVKRVGESVFIEGVASSDFEADRNITLVKMMLSPPTSIGARELGSAPEPKLLMTVIDMQRIRKKSPNAPH